MVPVWEKYSNEDIVHSLERTCALSNFYVKNAGKMFEE